MTEPLSTAPAAQTVTIDGQHIANTRTLAPGEVAHERLHAERETLRGLRNFAKSSGLTLAEESVTVRWKLEVTATGFPTPQEINVEIGRLRHFAEHSFAKGDRHAAREYGAQADELQQNFQAAVDRAYGQNTFISWAQSTETDFAEQLADLAKLEERQLQNRSAVVDE